MSFDIKATENRAAAQILVAAEIAKDDEATWARLTDEQKHKYLTLADRVISTVERKMTAWSWQ